MLRPFSFDARNLALEVAIFGLLDHALAEQIGQSVEFGTQAGKLRLLGRLLTGDTRDFTALGRHLLIEDTQLPDQRGAPGTELRFLAVDHLGHGGVVSPGEDLGGPVDCCRTIAFGHKSCLQYQRGVVLGL